MLELQLFCFGSIAGPHYHLCGTIAPVSGGRLVTYATELCDHHGERVAQGQLQDHPRWSEPLVGIVARCLDSALQGCHLDRWFDYGHASLDIALNGRRINYLACVEQPWLTLSRENAPQQFDGTAQPNPWSVASLACAAAAWKQNSLPPMPEPQQMSVYDHEGTRYCRTADLPQEARALLESWSFGASRPAVPGVPDAVFEWDMRHFLGAA